jgi:hypothetical protein
VEEVAMQRSQIEELMLTAIGAARAKQDRRPSRSATP